MCVCVRDGGGGGGGVISVLFLKNKLLILGGFDKSGVLTIP